MAAVPVTVRRIKGGFELATGRYLYPAYSRVMKRNLLLLWGTMALVLLFVVPGTAVASQDGDRDGTGDVGICVVGVESPCNGPAADGTDGADPAPARNVTADEGEPIQFRPDELPSASGVADGDVPVNSTDESEDRDAAVDSTSEPDGDDTPVDSTDGTEGDGEPIQFHPDELPYASGMAGEDSPETESSGGLLAGLVAWVQGLLAFVASLF